MSVHTWKLRMERVFACGLLLSGLSLTAAADEQNPLDSARSRLLGAVDANGNQRVELDELADQVARMAQFVDANQDGRIAADELQAAAQDARESARNQLRHSLAELRTRVENNECLARLDQRVQQAVLQIDKDKSGAVSRTEAIDAVESAVNEARRSAESALNEARQSVETAVNEARKRLEAREQQLSATAAGVAQRLADARPDKRLASAALGNLDTNADGKISREEMQILAQQAFAVMDLDQDGALTENEVRDGLAKMGAMFRRQLEQRVEQLGKPEAK